MEFTLEQGREFTVLPEGEIYTAELVSATVVEKPWTDKLTGDPVKKVSFDFRIIDGEYKNQHVWGESWTDFNKNSQLYRWVKELLGQNELEVGFKFELEALAGLFARIVIGHRPKKNKANEVIGTYYFVDDVIRASDVPTTADTFEDESPF